MQSLYDMIGVLAQIAKLLAMFVTEHAMLQSHPHWVQQVVGEFCAWLIGHESSWETRGDKVRLRSR